MADAARVLAKLARPGATKHSGFSTADDPVAFLTARDLVTRRAFYPKLARAAGLRYFPTIPSELSGSASVVQQIPLTVLMTHQVYPLSENGRLTLVTANPFLPRAARQEILSYTRFDRTRLAIAHPEAVRQAIVHMAYQPAGITSEAQIETDQPLQSAHRFLSRRRPQIVLLVLLAAVAGAFVVSPGPAALTLFFVLNLVYFIVNPQKTYTFFKALLRQRTLVVTPADLRGLSEPALPRYTILAPLKEEVADAPKLVRRLNALDYPPERLDFKFIVGTDDTGTIDALHRAGVGVLSDDASPLGTFCHLVRMPPGPITTKPLACNFALTFARGQYSVIYDAEDKPDRDQLKKAVAGFAKSDMRVACIQARLNFYNSRKNILTRLFSLEYGYWFDFFLPGLQTTDSPIPLGGTSNHFVTAYLRQVGAWDPYNVTEDADLGLRISRLRYRTAMMNSYTLEEAVSRTGPWIRQRTRWEKGFLMTFLVHISHPIRLTRDLGLRRTLLSLNSFGASYFLPFANPFLWLAFLGSLWPDYFPQILPPVPGWLLAIGIFNLVFGNLAYVTTAVLSALRNRRLDLVPFVIFLPAYWLLISVATYRAMVQFLTRPFYWEKTEHGRPSGSTPHA